jgi:single-strand DNA-binding protein
MIEAAFFGTVAKDAELRTSRAGKPFVSMSVAVDDKAHDGEKSTQWVMVTAFGEQAERLCRSPLKGARVYAEGILRLEEWTPENGEKRFSLKLAAFKCERVGASAIGRNRERRSNSNETTRNCQSPLTDRRDFNDRLPF